MKKGEEEKIPGPGPDPGGVKGRAFGSPLARGLYPRASTAEVDPRVKPGSPAAVVSRRRISDRETRSLIQAAIEKAGRISPLPSSLEPGGWKRGGSGLIRSLPAWVGRFGFLTGPNEFGLWCEPLPGPREAFPSQLVIDVPPGRYMIEILDAETSTWVSRESAEGGPLVAGLPCTGNSVLIWIRSAC